MTIPLTVNMWHKTTNVEALLDCGATHNFIDPQTISSLHMGTRLLPQPLIVRNVDRTINCDGTITRYCNLWVQQGKHEERLGFYVANLGQDRIILGYPWFKLYNPTFNWQHNTLQGEEVEIDTAGYRSKQTRIRVLQLPLEELDKERAETLQLIPPQYSEYWEVFSEKAARRFPPSRPDDHAIVLKPGAPDTLDCKIYRQTDDELKVTREFIDDGLAKGYLQESKSPYASPMFYRAKQDGKLRPIIDYRCYGRSTVLSDLDGVGVVLNVDGGSWQELDYNKVRTTEQWMNTQGESACQALKRMEGRDSTKYAPERMYRDVAEAVTVLTEGP
jgi:hypothetical protein